MRHCELLHIPSFSTSSTGTYEFIGLVMCPTMFSINKDSTDVKKIIYLKISLYSRTEVRKLKRRRNTVGARRVVPLQII
jgi:hypothetical protein